MTNKPGIAAPWATVDGKTISQWAGVWLQNVMTAPATDPLVDPFNHTLTDGDQIAHGGPVAFLYGGNWSGSSIPDVHINAGQDVFVPLTNAVDVESSAAPLPGAQDNIYSTIPNWHEKTHLGYGAEAKFVSAAGSVNIDEAHLTVAKASDPTHPILSLKWPVSEAYIGDSGVISLGTQSDATYVGNAFLGPDTDMKIDLPYADVAGRWAMLTNLPKGDYLVNYGGSMAPLVDPFNNKHVILSGSNGGDVKTDTTVHLFVGT
jgi:hypothetical protein